ncbi:MAG: PAS domain-containing sensor histidine kinase, partial [Dehalococcoidales bacterium]
GERYRAIFEQAADSIALIDAETGELVEFNERAHTNLGYTNEEFKKLKIPDFEVIESAEEVKGHIDKITKQGFDFFETKHRTKSGGIRSIQVSSRAISVGGRDFIQSIWRDITERKQAEEELRESERQYRLLAENAEDVIWTVDMNMRPTYMSPSITRLLGYSVEEAMAKPMEAVYSPASFETAMKALAEELAIENMEQKDLSRSRTLELDLNRKDGSIVPVEVKFSFIREPDGRPVNILAIARDITERKWTERELTERMKKLKCLYGISKFAEIASITLDELYQEVMNLLPSVWHYPEITGVRITINDKKFETENYIDTKWAQSSDIKVHGARAGTVEVGYLEERPEIDRGPFLEEEKLFIDAIAEQLGRIAEHKQTGEKIEELYQNEKELRQDLETQIESRVEFTRALIHELKTPLTPIVASSSLLVEELREPLVRIARNINQGAVNLSVRIDELLDVAKGELNMIELDLKPVDILKMSRRVANEIAPMISSSKQSLILDLPPTFPVVSADEGRLEQVMMNLLGNASKFTPEGGKITIRVKQEEGVATLSVQDNGPGIGEEEQKRIFEIYYRKKSDRQRLVGLGLGLALSKMLVELHRGRIWVESRLGAGAKFSFSIPLGAIQQEPKASETGK